MTEKRFYIKCDEINAWSIWETGKDVIVFDLHKSDAKIICDLLNELHEENQQIKDLIHTMLEQIDVENITSDSAIYSARIIFNRNDFNLIRELWKRS